MSVRQVDHEVVGAFDLFLYTALSYQLIVFLIYFRQYQMFIFLIARRKDSTIIASPFKRECGWEAAPQLTLE